MTFPELTHAMITLGNCPLESPRSPVLHDGHPGNFLTSDGIATPEVDVAAESTEWFIRSRYLNDDTHQLMLVAYLI